MNFQLNIDDRKESRTANRGLNAMGAEVVNSTFVLLLSLCSKLNICTSNPPLRQAPNRCGETPLRYVRHIVAADYIRLNVLRIASHIKRIGKITTLANFVCVS